MDSERNMNNTISTQPSLTKIGGEDLELIKMSSHFNEPDVFL